MQETYLVVERSIFKIERFRFSNDGEMFDAGEGVLVAVIVGAEVEVVGSLWMLDAIPFLSSFVLACCLGLSLAHSFFYSSDSQDLHQIHASLSL